MGNALVPFKVSLPAVSAEQLESLEEVAKGVEYLARLTLVTKGKYVDTGKIPPGHWGVPLPGGEEIDDLGISIDIIPLCYRPKALDMADKEAIIAVYDTSDPEFQRIKTAPKNSGCMWGPSFLVLERSTGKLFEMFFGNKSGRMEAGKLKAFLPTEANEGQPMPATMNIRYVNPKTTDFAWHVPVIVKCSEPFDQAALKVTAKQIDEEATKFLNPEKGAEKVPEEKKEEGKKTRAR